MGERDVSGREDSLTWVEAYHDGELALPRRLWAEWRLRRDPRARAELAALRALGGALRDLEAGAPAREAPDFWPAVGARLPERGRAASWLAPAPWAAGAALAAAAALALVVLRDAPEVAPPAAHAGAVRWLDAHDRPMMVLRDDAEATIIWVPDPAKDRAARRREMHGTA
jgi:anti-sigma factor RsiW